MLHATTSAYKVYMWGLGTKGKDLVKHNISASRFSTNGSYFEQQTRESASASAGHCGLVLYHNS
jgi:hypothetical protein